MITLGETKLKTLFMGGSRAASLPKELYPHQWSPVSVFPWCAAAYHGVKHLFWVRLCASHDFTFTVLFITTVPKGTHSLCFHWWGNWGSEDLSMLRWFSSCPASQCCSLSESPLSSLQALGRTTLPIPSDVRYNCVNCFGQWNVARRDLYHFQVEVSRATFPLHCLSELRSLSLDGSPISLVLEWPLWTEIPANPQWIIAWVRKMLSLC